MLSEVFDTTQFGLFFAHGIAIVPEVTSLNTQVLAGAEVPLELQLDVTCSAASA